MDFFSNHHKQAQEAYETVQSGQHEGRFSHELLAGAGSFMAMRKYEQHLREQGKPANHAFAKEMLMAFAGAEVDKLIETKGLDAIDAHKAKEQAKQQAMNMYDAQYGNEQY